jgi:parallel beta-helix repeat protein
VVRRKCSNDSSLDGESPPTTGIALADADGIVVRGNVTRGNGDYGIHLSDHIGGGSDDNRLFDNVASGNGVSEFGDDGSGNCGGGNSFSVPPCP